MKNHIAQAKEIMMLGILLDAMPGVDTYVTFHGNTDCLCVQISLDGEQVYENRAFITNARVLSEIKDDISRMILAALKIMKGNIRNEV